MCGSHHLKAFLYDAKVQGLTPKPKDNFNNSLLVTIFYEDVNNILWDYMEKD